MATIRPFKGIRPDQKYADKVAALPYDVMDSNEAREMVKGNPYSFLHIDKAEIDLDKDINIYDEKVYQKAKSNFDKMIEDKVFIQDNSGAFYIYSLTMDGRTQTGLVVCTSIDEYLDGIIKKHELTREEKEQDRIKHVDTLNANTGPIFLAYRAKKEVSDIINNYRKDNEPIYDFISEDGVGHKAWIISDNEIINKLVDLFGSIPNLYIADGHHRNASAVKVGLKRRGDGDYDKNAEFNFYLSVLFPDDELYIMDYNRIVKDLNGLSSEDFLKKVAEKFTIEEVNETYKPEKLHTFGMYLDGKWYKLTAKDEIIGNDVISKLDVSILQENLLGPILDIDDPRTNKRIDFVGGIRGLSELEDRVNKGEKVAFSMYPTSMTELFAVADADKIMPPKSTWFEPKLRSGLFIHSLS